MASVNGCDGNAVSKVVFVADFFKEDVTGGAEINDGTLIDFLHNANLLHDKIHCHKLTPEYILENTDKYYIISNFINLNGDCKSALYQNSNYSIYEHDYKFILERNPIKYTNFMVPKSRFINIPFYKGAHRVICLSKMQKEIYDKNLQLENLENIGTSLFSEELIQFLLSLSKNKKIKKYAVIESSNPIKRTKDAENFCVEKGYEYDLISHQDNNKFLEILSEYENLVFMTGHPEPTPRIAIECKLMGVNIIAPKKLIGIASEAWFNTTGIKFVKGLREARKKAYELFLCIIDEKKNQQLLTKRRKVFIDGGAHKGESIDKFNSCFIRSDEFEIYSFEPNALFGEIILQKGKNVRLNQKAIWIEDGEIQFYGTDVPHRSDGCSVVYEKNNISRTNPINVESIDFSHWLEQNFSKEDFIILKLDIEGAEYKVLDRMIDNGTIDYVDLLYVEFHASKMVGYAEFHKELLEKLKTSGQTPLFWDALDYRFKPETQGYNEI